MMEFANGKDDIPYIMISMGIKKDPKMEVR